MKTKIMAALFTVVTFAGCASSVDGALFSNTAKVHLFTAKEQADMTADGAVETMVTPSEIRQRFRHAGQVTKPTGVVNYCAAGMSSLIQSRRHAALEAIDGVCGGKGQYTIRREGPGYVEVSHAGYVRIGSDCNRPMGIYFRCSGAQPKAE